MNDCRPVENGLRSEYNVGCLRFSVECYYLLHIILYSSLSYLDVHVLSKPASIPSMLEVRQLGIVGYDGIFNVNLIFLLWKNNIGN